MINADSLTQGNYSVMFKVWDIFHDNNPSEITVYLDISDFVPSYFEMDLPSSLTVQIWNKTIFDLPNILDENGDFANIVIKQQR